MRHFALTALIAVFLALPCFSALGDTLLMKDGSTIEGRIVSDSRSKIVIETKISNIKTMQTVLKREIEDIKYSPLPDDFWESDRTPEQDKPDPEAAEKPAIDEEEDEHETERESRPAADNGEKTYFAIVPINGGIGVEVNAYGLRKALTNISKQRVEHVVFVIDSPGGYIYSAVDMMEIMKEFDEKLTYHAVIEEGAISAASIFAACADNIFVRPGSRLGGAVAYSNDQSTGNAQVDAKMNSIWAAEVASRAESNGHMGELFRAMAVIEVQLWQAPDGTISATRSAGAEEIDSASTILTIRANQLVKAGMAREIVGELEGLGELLGIEQFTERKRLADRTMLKAGSDVAKLQSRYEQAEEVMKAALEELERNDPIKNNDYEIVRRLNRNNVYAYGFKGDSGARWNRRVKESVRQAETMLKALKEYASISKAAERYNALHLVTNDRTGTKAYRETEMLIQRLNNMYGSPPWGSLVD